MIIVGRDIAHAKLKERMDNGEGLPQYITKRSSDLLRGSGQNAGRFMPPVSLWPNGHRRNGWILMSINCVKRRAEV